MAVRGVGEPRRPCEWAQLHAGIEFISPPRDREIMQLRGRGHSVQVLADAFDLPTDEVEKTLARVARTLCTWERNACRWSTRFVAQEPMSEEGRNWRPGDSKNQSVS